MESVDLEQADIDAVKDLQLAYAQNRKALDKAEKQIVAGGMDILMMFNGESLQKSMQRVTALTDELKELRDVREKELMRKLSEKYGEGRLEPYTMKWIKN